MKEILTLLLLCVSLTGCFDILEELELKKDGSGTYKLTLNLSKSRTKVASIMLMDSINGHRVPSQKEVKERMAHIRSELNGKEGLSNASVRHDFDNYIFSVSVDFQSVDQLKEGLWATSKDNSRGSLDSSLLLGAIQVTDLTIQRDYPDDRDRFASRIKEEDKAVLKDANLYSIIRLEQQVEKVSNPAYRISKNQKSVMLKAPWQEIIFGDKNLDNTITLKSE